MSRDQPTELRRGGATTASQRPGGSRPLGDGDRAPSPVPEDNRPGHHPDHEQDRPDPDAFVARFQDHLVDDDLATAEPARHVMTSPSVEPHPRVDHGANDAPVVVEQSGPGAVTLLVVPLRVVGVGARGLARVFKIGARLADGVADRVDPR
jgi:hypothetical protein